MAGLPPQAPFGQKWDPKSLLNPKAQTTSKQHKPAFGSAPPSAGSQSPLASRQTQSSQMQFQFDSPSANGSGSPARATNGFENANAGKPPMQRLAKMEPRPQSQIQYEFTTPAGDTVGNWLKNKSNMTHAVMSHAHPDSPMDIEGMKQEIARRQANGTLHRYSVFENGDGPGVKQEQVAHRELPRGYGLPTGSMDGANGMKQENGYAVVENPVGMARMLQKVHNVVDRDQMPQKRRKLGHKQEPQDHKKAIFAGVGQGGVLGEYMKEKREEGKQEQATNGSKSNLGPVDLTGDDDDEVEMVDPGDVEVCYGRLDGVKVKACRVPLPRPGATALDPNNWPPIKVTLKREPRAKHQIITVCDGTRTCFGSIDVTTAMGLVPIIDSPSIGVRTSTKLMSRAKKPGEKPGDEISYEMDLDLTLYGPRKNAQQVGRFLSQKNLWLRAPFMIEPGILLNNPHEGLRNMAPRNGNRCLGYTAVTSATARTVEEVRSEVLGMFDNLRRSENMEESEPGPLIKTELLQHQKQGLTFMLAKEQERTFGDADKENSSLWRQKITATGSKTYTHVITSQTQNQAPPEVLGGILADMMGLGKTLSILSLISATKGKQPMIDWANALPSPPTEEDPVPLRVNSRATLLVSPLSTISNWETQIDEHVKPGGLKVHIYHGASKCKDVNQLANYDVVITTYGSVASEFSRREKKKVGTFPLQEINWFRIVLDEAHMIREQATLNSKAVCRLQAQRRWAVTGTPVQNRLDDLGALLKFLRLKPFDEKRAFAQYVLAPCKNADPEIYGKLRLLVDSITLRRLKDRINLPPRHDKIVRLEFTKSEQELYDIFAKNASDRVKALTNSADNEKALGGKSYVHILQSILRLRLICAHGRDLLSEQDLKDTLGTSKDSAIDLEDEENDPNTLTPKKAYNMYNLLKETGQDKCSVCTTQIGRNTPDSEDEGKQDVLGHMSACFHLICGNCIKEHKKAALAASYDGGKRARCPLCHQDSSTEFFPLKASEAETIQERIAEVKDAKEGKTRPPYEGPHTKTRELVRELLDHDAESLMNPNEPPIKSVVLSGWTSHLDLVQRALEDHHITFTRLDGKMSRIARGQALDTFREDPNIHVILVSISAGGLGLNLTTANKVYVMEPQYNPAAEAQAIDRVHRLGQNREVETVRFVMKDSFEEKMLVLQEKKRKLASFTVDRDKDARTLVGGSKADATRKRLEDLRSLFK